MNKHRYKIYILENKMLKYLGVFSIFFPLENVWGMVMVCLNSFSLVPLRVWTPVALSSQKQTKKIQILREDLVRETTSEL